MGRSTFEGPILSGDQRFGPQRDVGYALLSQVAYLDFSNTTPSTAGYSGSSKVFVTPNNIPNQAATIYNPQAGSYSAAGPTAATAPTADVAGTIYRGAVFNIPAGSYIQNVYLDYLSTPTDAATLTLSTIACYVSNNFATASGVYATIASNTSSAVGRTTASFSLGQYLNSQSTLQDVQNIQPGQQPTWFSQVVVTLAMSGNSANAPTSGKLQITLQYLQSDPNIGNGTTYPYGNFD
jgi:hypothetical protein